MQAVGIELPADGRAEGNGRRSLDAQRDGQRP